MPISARREHFVHLFARERFAFRRALNLDKFPRAGADNVHINFGVGIFDVGEIENRRVFDNPDADGGNFRKQRRLFDFAVF